MSNFQTDLNIVLRTIEKASGQIRRDFYELSNLQSSKKGSYHFANHTKTKTLNTLIEKLQKARPHYGFLTEKGEIQALEPNDNEISYKWIITPIDGIENFEHVIPFFCISIALASIVEKKVKIILGVVSNPITNETFYAGTSTGSYKINDLGLQKKIKISNATNDLSSIICSIHDTNIEFNNLKKYFYFLSKENCNIRFLGSSALELAYLAEGKINIFANGKVNLWNYAAGYMIASEAGAIFKNLDGEDLSFDKKETGILAYNKYIYDNLINV